MPTQSFNRSVNGWGFKVSQQELTCHQSTIDCLHHEYHSHERCFALLGNTTVLVQSSQRLLQEGPDHKSWYHELFLRGKPELTILMERLVNPGKRIPDKQGMSRNQWYIACCECLSIAHSTGLSSPRTIRRAKLL